MTGTNENRNWGRLQTQIHVRNPMTETERQISSKPKNQKRRERHMTALTQMAFFVLAIITYTYAHVRTESSVQKLCAAFFYAFFLPLIHSHNGQQCGRPGRLYISVEQKNQMYSENQRALCFFGRKWFKIIYRRETDQETDQHGRKKRGNAEKQWAHAYISHEWDI